MLTGQLIFRVVCLREKKTGKIQISDKSTEMLRRPKEFWRLNRLPCLLICDFCCCGTFLCGYSGRMLFVSNWVLLHVFGIYSLCIEMFRCQFRWVISLFIFKDGRRWWYHTIRQRQRIRRDIFEFNFGYASAPFSHMRMNWKSYQLLIGSVLGDFIFVMKIHLLISKWKNWNANESLAMDLFDRRWHERWVACDNKTPDKYNERKRSIGCLERRAAIGQHCRLRTIFYYL